VSLEAEHPLTLEIYQVKLIRWRIESAALTSHSAVWKLTRLGTSPSTANNSKHWVTDPVLQSCRKLLPMNASITRRWET
jgi:hypothetical protein